MNLFFIVVYFTVNSPTLDEQPQFRSPGNGSGSWFWLLVVALILEAGLACKT